MVIQNVLKDKQSILPCIHSPIHQSIFLSHFTGMTRTSVILTHLQMSRFLFWVAPKIMMSRFMMSYSRVRSNIVLSRMKTCHPPVHPSIQLVFLLGNQVIMAFSQIQESMPGCGSRVKIYFVELPTTYRILSVHSST